MNNSRENKNSPDLDDREISLSNLLANLPGIAYRCLNDEYWTMKFVSSGCFDLTGYLPEELIDNKILAFVSIIHPNDRLIGRKEIENAIANHTSFQIEYRIIDKNGKIKWIWEKGSAVYNEKKEALYIEGFITDISDRKNTEQELNQKWSNYNNIVENLPLPVIIYTPEGKILYANPKAIELSGMSTKEYGSNNVSDFIAPKFLNKLEERRKAILPGGELPSISIEANNLKGETFFIEINSASIIYNGVPAMQTIVTDITARKQLQEEKIKTQVAEQTNQILTEEINRRIQSEQKLKAIFESGSQLMWMVNKELSLTAFNKNFAHAIYDTYGVYPEINIDEPKKDILSKEYHTFWDKKYYEVLTGKPVEFETRNKNKQGRTIYRKVFLYPIYNDKSKITEISGLAYDITEQKEIEQKILITQSQLSAIINNTTDIVVSIDKDYNVVQFNRLLFDMAKRRNGIELKEGVSIFETLDISQHGDIRNIYKRVFTEGQNLVAVEMFTITEDRKLYYETNYNPIKQNDEIVGIAIFSRDISSKIVSESELRGALKEKEVLLKEVHHRVKNNLQVISSILNLQTSYVKDKETANMLKECQNRIKTMAYIHESLYQTKDFLHINFGEYIINLVKNLFYSYDANQQKIKANFDVDTIFLNLDTSIPCGLIINELVSNAFKYAFADNSQGFITVKVKKLENNKIKMIVADNGKGIPHHIDYKNTESLGLQLVNILAEQINGTITLNKTNGTIFEIIF
jgi:PAS domain S-box-containing protein